MDYYFQYYPLLFLLIHLFDRTHCIIVKALTSFGVFCERNYWCAVTQPANHFPTIEEGRKLLFPFKLKKSPIYKNQLSTTPCHTQDLHNEFEVLLNWLLL